MHTIWLREHNRLVTELADVNPHWNDDRLFFEARKIVGAQMQKITYGEWLPTVLGPAVMKVFRLPLQRLGYYRGYRSTTNPTATSAFGTAAFRFGHSLVQHTLMRCDKTGRRVPFTIRLHQELMNPSNIHNFGSVDRLMLGLAFERAQGRDATTTAWTSPPSTSSVGVTMGCRPTTCGASSVACTASSTGENCCRSWTTTPWVGWRRSTALTAAVTGIFCCFVPDANPPLEQTCPVIRAPNEKQKFFGDDVSARLITAIAADLPAAARGRHRPVLGGLAEKPVLRGLVGPTFACILGQQFLNLRRGDRFWFENGGFVSSLSPDQLKEIRKVTLARVMCDNLDDIDDLQPNVFRPPTENGRNVRKSCEGDEIPSLDLGAWKEHVDTEFPGLQYAGGNLNLSVISTQQEQSEFDYHYDDDYLSGLPEEELFYLEPQDDLDDYDEEALQKLYSNELPRPFEEADEKSGKEEPAPVHGGGGPGLSQLTDHNFNNVIEHAYSDTLFYGRSLDRN
ncbi:hypothetical protein C7M84_012293 [Penaeus vannamei]|uniref:Uncharacterized protein n=1 Tax=Penaeus vannamei TaxID=6689 RepID=A0A3R7QJJ2_PENVA|nr:hypothetical protein C7M84_012293 [Penaeus vannamei]